MRWGELAAPKVKNVDLLKGTIKVTEAVAEVNGNFFEGPTKTGVVRTISMPGDRASGRAPLPRSPPHVRRPADRRANPKEIQERLGYSTIRVTFDRYGHLFPSLDERLRDGLEETCQPRVVPS